MRSPVAKCPACERTLGDIPPQGLLDATCHSCRRRYQFVRGRVVEVTADRGAAQFSGGHILRLERANKRIETIALPAAAFADGIPVDAGHILSAVYTARGVRRDALIAIYNATTGQTRAFILPEEGDVAFKAWMLGGAAGFFAQLLLAGWGMSWWLAIVGGSAAGIGIGVACSHQTLIDSWPLRTDESELSPVQLLASEKLNLEENEARIFRRLANHRVMSDNLLSLRERMTRLGLPIYEQRIARLDHVVGMLADQMELDRKLCDGYRRGIQMIDIELDASSATDLLEDDVAEHLAIALRELNDMEEAGAELSRRLAASAEVEAMLRLPRRGPSPSAS